MEIEFKSGSGVLLQCMTNMLKIEVLLLFTSLTIFFINGAHAQSSYNHQTGQSKSPNYFRFIHNLEGNNIYLKGQDSQEKLYPYANEVVASNVTGEIIIPNIGIPMNFPSKVGEFDKTEAFYLASRNTEVPFPYLQEGSRSWPILQHALPDGFYVNLTAKLDGKVLASGFVLHLHGITVTIDDKQKLTITSKSQENPLAFSLELRVALPNGTIEQQTLSIVPAPPIRPLSYLADFGDDLIAIFNTSFDKPGSYGSWLPVTKDAFDQYFRRCQLQGVDRLILWLSPMPYITDSANYAPEDWTRYKGQVEAMVESPILNDLIDQRRKVIEGGFYGLHIPWDWIRQLNIYRLMSDFGPLLSQSAEDHGIKLTASFRPFETALTKYYELPVFDQDANFLWGFLPMATPVINYKTDQTAFAHYRTILEKMGMPDKGKIGRISISNVSNVKDFLKRFQSHGDNLRIVASNYPPLRSNSLVLQRQYDTHYELVKFGDFATQAEEKQRVVTNYKISVEGDVLHIDNLDISSNIRYLILSNPAGAVEALDFPTFEPVKLFARAGNAIGRENVYWVLDVEDSLSSLTRVPGIPVPNVEGYGTEFHTTEDGYKHLYQKGDARTTLKNCLLVIDLGAPYSVEMLDLNQPAMRDNVIKEMKTILDLPAFDEIFVNTRSHVSLSAYLGDGKEGIKPLVYYRQNHLSSQQLGIDRAYAPLAVANDSILKKWAADPRLVERITTWQHGEWDGYCQQEDSPYRWRYARNKAVSKGVRLLLEDFEVAFPNVRTRVVIPMRESSAQRVDDRIKTLIQSDSTHYSRNYNSGIWSTINYIRSIGEGMAMIDLTGLKTEPVLFGIRGIPDAAPLDIYFEESLRDFSNNRGSEYRGPRSFFFEAQSTLRNSHKYKEYELARKERENIICKVLSFKEDVKEVILYEAVDWLYKLPFDDLDLTGNYFIERCEPIEND